MSIDIGNFDTPSRKYLEPSTAYVRGFKYAMVFIHSGMASIGYMAPLKKTRGNISIDMIN